ncbi:MAG: DUF6519 domain-containing protein [Microcystis sp. LE18-22.4A]|uniref:DUF6519 domain-containing protein n=1 Tax=Microcystis sp. LE18-22.4A TaxID=3016432 RepID=UPI0022CB11CA|nr:DUF6519 domain-containing protein [Microcystis sp. LE18-22.4A]MCZ8117961.1 DUF6519 domain-containing protein [Microcystis sp. LE18-22.4A]
MEGNFSRSTFKASKRYHRVFMQQGRVQLDADWNEAIDSITHNQQSAIRYLIGDCAVPYENGGFRIFKQDCLKFNGKSNYLNLGSRFSLANSDSFAIEALVCPRWEGNGGTILSKFNLNPSNDYQGEYRLFIKPNGTVVFQRIELLLDQQNAELVRENTLDYSDAIYLHSLEAIKVIELGRFVHIAVVSIGNNLYLFVDDQLVATSYQFNEYQEASDIPFLIGAQWLNEQPDNFFDGLIADILISEILNREALEQNSLNFKLKHLQKQPHWSLLQNKEIISTNLNGNLEKRYSPPIWLIQPLFISHGVAYTGGILCENEADILLTEQLELPHSALPNLESLQGIYLVYLDVWSRYISSISDPTIREIALGGADTTGRSKIICQVKLLALENDNNQQQWIEKFQQLARLNRQRGQLKARHDYKIPIKGNYLYRIEIHNPGFVSGCPLFSAEFLPILKGQLIEANCFKIIEGNLKLWENQEWLEIIFKVASSTKEKIVKIQKINSENNQILLTDDLEYPLEQIFYLRPIATLKWSKENGSITYPIQKIETSEKQETSIITIINSPPGTPALQNGDWIEIVDDDYVLANQIKHLCQIQHIDGDISSPTTRLTVNPAPPAKFGRNRTKYPFVRRWDQKQMRWNKERNVQLSPLKSGVIPLRQGWLEIEDGIEIQFEEDAIYQQRDYWWIPARTINNSIEWPVDEQSNPKLRNPQGIEHHYMPLALVQFNQAYSLEILKDLRNIVPNLGDWLSKSGGTITGDLTVEGMLAVESDTFLRRNVTVGRLYGELAPNLVDTPQVVDDAITPEKLAPNIGFVPPQYSILGSSPIAPPEYTYTGFSITVPVLRPQNWQEITPPMPKAGRVYTTVIEEKIYCLWETGELWAYQPNNALELWQEKKPMPDPKRKAFAVGVINNKLHVIGGYVVEGRKAGEKTGLHYEYDPESDQWNLNRPPMPTPRSHLGIGVVGQKLYAIGGQISGFWGLFPNLVTGVNEVYDLVTNQWLQCPSLPRARSAFGIGEYQGAIYLFGGQKKKFCGLWGDKKVPWCDIYVPLKERWFRQKPLPMSLSHMGISAIAGQFYIIGGTNSWSEQDSTFVYDAQTQIWRQAAPLQEGRKSLGTAFLDGSIYIFGGVTAQGKTASIEKIHINSIFYIYQKLT